MLKNGINVIKKKGVHYFTENGKRIKYKPWLGDMFSFLYDSIMRNSVFPKKFGASIETHNQLLLDEYSKIQNCNVLELATGSGNVSELISHNNRFVGIDISEGLLRLAYKKFSTSGFNNFDLFLSSADDLPFQDNYFDFCICNLSLNFFPDVSKVISEIQRVIKNNAACICSVPVPERNEKARVIRGTLYSEEELKKMFEDSSFLFTPYDVRNGALLYFKAVLEQE